MGFVPAEETWGVTLRFTATGLRPKTMNFVVRDDNWTGTSTSAGLLAAAIETWADAEYDPTYGTGLVLSNIQVRDMSSQTGVVVDHTANVAGTHAGNGMPGNVAFCISLRTGLAGKSQRGRMYHPWLAESDVTGNSLSQAAADAIIDAWTALNTTLNASGWHLAVMSRRTNGADRQQAQVLEVSNIMYVDLNVDTQRRRVRPL